MAPVATRRPPVRRPPAVLARIGAAVGTTALAALAGCQAPGPHAVRPASAVVSATDAELAGVAGGARAPDVFGATPAAIPADPSAPRPGVKRVRSLLEMRRAGVILQEWDASCGAAALATVLRHHQGVPVTERAAATAMLAASSVDQIRRQGGFSLLDMKRFTDGLGVGLTGLGYGELTTADLAALAPVIVPIRAGTGPHFVVVRGRAGDRLLLADPAFGNRTLPARRFEEAWIDRLGFVVARRDGAPAPRRPALAYAVPAPPPALVRSVLAWR